MAAFAERLDPCVNWFKVLSRTKGRILWLFPIVLIVGYVAAVRSGDPVGGFFERSSQRRRNQPLLDEARALNLDYEKVLAGPQAYVGKPVVWCVSTTGSGSSYVSTRQAWPVKLEGSLDAYQTANGGSAEYCLNILAVVTGFERGLIQLRPVEKL